MSRAEREVCGKEEGQVTEQKEGKEEEEEKGGSFGESFSHNNSMLLGRNTYQCEDPYSVSMSIHKTLSPLDTLTHILPIPIV